MARREAARREAARREAGAVEAAAEGAVVEEVVVAAAAAAAMRNVTTRSQRAFPQHWTCEIGPIERRPERCVWMDWLRTTFSSRTGRY